MLEPVLILNTSECCVVVLFINFCPFCPQGPVMPGSHSVERFVIEENLHCIIKTHWKERKTWWETNGVMVQICPVLTIGLKFKCFSPLSDLYINLFAFQCCSVTQLSREK